MAKYTADDRAAMAKSGAAMADGSYPIADKADLQNAIHAVGRGGGSHDAIRAHIIKRAKAMGMMSMVPPNWNPNGSMMRASDALANAYTSDDAGDAAPGATAMPDGSYAITTVEQLQAAIEDLTGATSQTVTGTMDDIREHLINRARALGCIDLIPTTWWEEGTVLVPRAKDHYGNELRQFFISDVELRGSKNTPIFHGYASTFNDPYPVRDKYGEFHETILPGAFARSLANRGEKIHLLVEHGGIPLASTRNQTLKLEEDTHGLRVEAQLAPDESPLHADVAYAVRSGAMDEMSIGFRVPSDGDRWNDNQSERTISQASLVEVSVLPRGANKSTVAGVREEQLVAEIRRLEQTLSNMRNYTDPRPARTRAPKLVNELARLHALRRSA